MCRCISISWVDFVWFILYQCLCESLYAARCNDSLNAVSWAYYTYAFGVICIFSLFHRYFCLQNNLKTRSYIRIFRWYRVQSHIWGRGSNIWGNAQIFHHNWGGRWSLWLCTRSLWISLYMRKIFHFFISEVLILYMRKIFLSFLSVQNYRSFTQFI